MRRVLRYALYVLGALAVAVVVLNWTYGRLPSEPKPSGSFVRVGSLRIHYLERPASGTPVVLIHGLPGTAEDFNAVTPLLAGHRTIAFDRPGFGYSTGGYVTFDRQIATLAGLLQALHVSRPILVGHSYGGTLALAFAERHPAEVGGLVLVDAAAAGQHLGGYDEFQAHLVKVLQLPVIHQIANATFSQLLTTVSVKQGDDEAFHPHAIVHAHERRLLEINSTRGNLEAFAGEQLAANGVIDAIDKHLATIAVPAVVIQGADDQLVKPAHGRELAARLANARLEIVSGGHMAPYTHPAAIANAVVSLAPLPKRSRPVAGATALRLRRPAGSGA
ncbi:MAG: alpha/beta fold hydrolase [Solirubrobacteraceae bacterium]